MLNTEQFRPGKSTIAFIGLGIMGLPMARNLMQAGFSLRVHNRSPKSVETLVAEGAFAASSPREAATGADAVILMLPNSPDVEAVLNGDHGVLAGARSGSVVIDMSTISPMVTRGIAQTLREHGIDMLDAPVSGGEKGAIAGALTIMVGGDAATFERSMPLLEVMGASVTLVGDSGSGQVAKACNQMIVAGNIQLVAEALTLARNSGVDPQKVRDALLGGFAGSKVLEVHGQRIIDRTFEPGFRSVLHQKDLSIALECGASARTPLPATAVVQQMLGALIATVGPDVDHSGLVQVTELMSRSGHISPLVS
jgi:2-hydroxy-3-oxopropionate reductase